MSFIKKIDAGLINLVTQLHFTRWTNKPSQRLMLAIAFCLLMVCLFSMPPLLIRGHVGAFNYLVIAAYLVAIFYHWRLQRRLKRSH